MCKVYIGFRGALNPQTPWFHHITYIYDITSDGLIGVPDQDEERRARRRACKEGASV